MTWSDWIPLGTSDADPEGEWVSMWSVTYRPTRWQRFREWFRVRVLRRPPSIFVWDSTAGNYYGYGELPRHTEKVTIDDDETLSLSEFKET